jgi:hypothetical protein
MTLRRGLIVLMMLLVAMPSMACFRSVCDAGKMGMNAAMPGCHINMPKNGGVVLMKDCLRNDLGQAVLVKMPVPEGAFIFIALAVALLLVPAPRRGSMLRHIRPPPDPRTDPFDILLATQRFRN